MPADTPTPTRPTTETISAPHGVTTTAETAIPPHDGRVVTVTPTIMDGLVVRWYRDLDAAQAGGAIASMASASRNGVLVHGYLHEVPERVLAEARRAHRLLSERRDADDEVRAMATHRPVFGRDDLEPIQREEATDAV